MRGRVTQAIFPAVSRRTALLVDLMTALLITVTGVLLQIDWY